MTNKKLLLAPLALLLALVGMLTLSALFVLETAYEQEQEVWTQPVSRRNETASTSTSTASRQAGLGTVETDAGPWSSYVQMSNQVFAGFPSAHTGYHEILASAGVLSFAHAPSVARTLESFGAEVLLASGGYILEDAGSLGYAGGDSALSSTQNGAVAGTTGTHDAGTGISGLGGAGLGGSGLGGPGLGGNGLDSAEFAGAGLDDSGLDDSGLDNSALGSAGPASENPPFTDATAGGGAPTTSGDNLGNTAATGDAEAETGPAPPIADEQTEVASFAPPQSEGTSPVLAAALDLTSPMPTAAAMPVAMGLSPRAVPEPSMLSLLFAAVGAVVLLRGRALVRRKISHRSPYSSANPAAALRSQSIF